MTEKPFLNRHQLRQRLTGGYPGSDHAGDQFDNLLHRVVEVERERCAKIAEAIDSKRGNEAEIARAIRDR